MVAKEIPKKATHQTASYRRLIDYIVRADSIQPLTHMANIKNCGVEKINQAVKVVTATQELARKGHDKTYHLVLSFHREDNLSAEKLDYIEEECCKALGFADHQRISVLHEDTDHPHLHIAINRVHPDSLRQITPWYSHRTLAKFCQRMEQELGLIPDNHQEKERKISLSAQTMEAYSGKLSLERYILNTLQPELSTGIRAEDFTSWEELHKKLAYFGLLMVLKDDSCVIGDPNEGIYLHSTILGTDFGRNSLEKRLGIFQSGEMIVPEKVNYQYQPTKNDILWENYRKQREAAIAARKETRKLLSEQQQEDYIRFRDKYATLRLEIKNDRLLSGRQKFVLYQKLAKTRKEEYEKLKKKNKSQRVAAREQNPLPTWQAYLVNKAIYGSGEALEQLKNHVSKRGLKVLAKLSSEQTKAVQLLLNIDEESIPNTTVFQTKDEESTVIQWISRRNALVGKASDVLPHHLLRPNNERGSFIYRGVRRLENNIYITLLERNKVMYVKNITEEQYIFSSKNINGGQTIEVDVAGYFHLNQGKLKTQSKRRGRR